MTFKETPLQLQMIDVTLIDPNPASPRRHIDETALKGLANSIQKKGLIHPLLVQPANAAGRYTLIVGERRWRAAVMAGEKSLPALIRFCEPDEALEIQVFENLGLGLRAALEPRDMANAIQTIAERFEAREAAAEHFGGTPNWLNQATAAANLSPKITALLDSGKISSTGAAVQLEKLTRKVVDSALSEAGGRRKRKEDAPIPQPLAASASSSTSELPPWEEAPAATSSHRRINPGKVKMVARILGLADGDEEEILSRLVDEFLAQNGEGNPQEPS